jgi:predicted tellurium resistance membrane protein TerC
VDIPSLLPFLALAEPVASAGGAGVVVHDLWSVQSLISFATLAALEIVLGIDNVIFIAILAGRLPRELQAKARRMGISLAVITRILLLFSISWVMGLSQPLFELFGQTVTGKQLILIGGGLFLIGKATFEIHDKLEGEEHAEKAAVVAATLGSVLFQILLIDMVFSLDSVITAVGMAQHIEIMIAAVMVSAGVMLVFAGPISNFVARHPTMKMLALAFLILIGVLLVAEAFDQHIDRGYIYFAMAFSITVELLNMRMRAQAPPVELRHSHLPDA